MEAGVVVQNRLLFHIFLILTNFLSIDKCFFLSVIILSETKNYIWSISILVFHEITLW